MAAAAIDIFQRNQGTVNFSKVKASGETGVIVKMSNGTGRASVAPDPYVLGATNAGLRVGGYHYGMGPDPVANANAFATALLLLPQSLDWAPALDYEDDTLPVSISGRRSWISSFFARLQVRIPWLNQVLLYASGSLLVAIDAGSLDTHVQAKLLIWDAEYGSNDGSLHNRTHYTGPVAVHQYTSNGRVDGVGTVVDRNAIYVDISARTTQEDDVTAADVWNYPLPNPNYDSTNPNSKPTYTAAELLAGTYGTELAVDSHLTTNQSGLLNAITQGQQSVDLTDQQVAEISAPITAALQTLPEAIKQSIGQALTAK